MIILDEKLFSKRYGQITIIDLNNKNSSPTLIVQLTGLNKNILEIGTSTGYMSKIFKSQGSSVTGIEIDPEAGLVAQEYCERMIIADVETLELDKTFAPGSFDVIVCGDVLEHLKNPESILKNIKKFLKPSGYLVVSLPNFCHGDVLLNIMNGDFRYTSVGLLDETHLRFFGLKNIFSLFARCGYRISDIQTTNLEIGKTELAVSQDKIPSDLLNFIKSLPNSSVYQYIFKAHPSQDLTFQENDEIDFTQLFTDALVQTRHELQSPLLLEISAQAREIQELTSRVDSVTRLNIEKDQHVMDLTNRVQSLDQTIFSMENSIVWQLTMKFHQNFIERVFPKNTQRRKNFDQQLSRIRRRMRSGRKSSFRRNALLTDVGSYLHRIFDRKKILARDTKKSPFLLKRSELTPEKREEIRQEVKQFAYLPRLSIITPVYNVDEKWLISCIDSVLNQIYGNWELCIVDDAGTRKQIAETLRKYAGSDDRIHVVFNKENRGISETTNHAINLATGEYIVFLDNDDILSEIALFEIVKLLNKHRDADVIYSDEDKIDSVNELSEPFFKPDWSPEYFRGVMYVGHVLTVRKTIAEKVGLLDKRYDYVQDYEFMLRLSENSKKIFHIPKILYHWRKIRGSVASDTGSKGDVGSIQVQAVNAHLQRCKLPATAQKSHLPHRVIISPLPRSDFPLVSIIIPTKDNPELIRRCLQSIFDISTYPHFEVIVVDNNTTNQQAIDIINSFPVKKVDYKSRSIFQKLITSGPNCAAGRLPHFFK